MRPFPEEWSKKIIDIAEIQENEFPVQMVTHGESEFPETRTVLLRYLKSADELFACTIAGCPKWLQVGQNPHLAMSTFLPKYNLSLRIRARGKCIDNLNPFTREAYFNMPELHKAKYLRAADGQTDDWGVPTNYGVIRLEIISWIVDELGEDGWTRRRRKYDLQSSEWNLTLDAEIP